jgi:hypothetical protein
LVGPERSTAQRRDSRTACGEVQVGEVAGRHRGSVSGLRVRLRLAAAERDWSGVGAGRRGRLVTRRGRSRGQGREHR